MTIVVVARLVLAVAYPLLAHRASVDGDNLLAAVALADLVLVVLLVPLVRLRGWAWVVMLLAVAGLWSLHDGDIPVLLLLAPPMLFTALVSWWFGRSLRPGRVPLISRIAAAMEACEPAALEPRLQRYTRRLTLAWALLLGTLALADGVLAMIAVPDGLLVRLGQPPLVSVSQQTWSWFANLLDYGIIGAFFVGEYLLRKRLFPDAPYRSFVDFLRRMAALGPRFWRDSSH
ncbi:ketosynthase [Lysobacter sp. A286]